MKISFLHVVGISFAGLTVVLTMGAIKSASAQQVDATKGADVFATHCSECHSLKEGKDKKGPTLFHIFGAKASQREGFAYSDAMRNSQLVWNAENLAAYVVSPKKFLPGGKMKYDGLDNPAELADLISFLAAQAKR